MKGRSAAGGFDTPFSHIDSVAALDDRQTDKRTEGREGGKTAAAAAGQMEDITGTYSYFVHSSSHARRQLASFVN